MDFNQIIKIVAIIGGSANVGIALSLTYKFILRKRPLEETEEFDSKGRILKRHKKFR
ncbi:hypothetical protein GCM10022289_20970 [Pedobacter jeongneungensis]|uniref:Uncharacterized protein n=1 Tax=Pedobacter jeongneungensis TaxID=947309 RepID=A0ABP8BD32_9SPHI